MPCNCTKKAGTVTYIYTDPNGRSQPLRTEIEAKAAVIRGGGSYTTR